MVRETAARSAETETRHVPIAGPSITDVEVNMVAKAARDGWHKDYQKYIRQFEAEFAQRVHRKFALATSSGSGALHLAYHAAGVGPGDEVIAPNITWVASVTPCKYLGATAVFADIEEDTWNIDPDDIERKITPQTKAILVVHLYGHMADMDAIEDIARRHKLAIIEDAAQAVGSMLGDRPAGSFGDVSAFSFTGTKTMVTGEGGMLLTDDEALYKRASLLNNQCQDPEKAFWNVDVGYKYKMSNMEAALGIAQLSRLDELIAKKREIFSWYEKRLVGVAGLQLNCERPGTYNTYWMSTVVWEKSLGMEKGELMRALGEYGIQTRPVFYPISDLPPFRQEVDTPVAMDLSPRAINLPSAHDLTEDDVEYVCAALRRILNV